MGAGELVRGGCSGVDAGVLDTERVFGCERRCCGVSAGVLDKELVFFSGRRCSWSWCGCSG